MPVRQPAPVAYAAAAFAAAWRAPVGAGVVASGVAFGVGFGVAAAGALLVAVLAGDFAIARGVRRGALVGAVATDVTAGRAPGGMASTRPATQLAIVPLRARAVSPAAARAAHARFIIVLSSPTYGRDVHGGTAA